MIRKKLLQLGLLSLMAFAFIRAQAQGWEKKYSPDVMMGVHSLYQLPDSNYIMTGWNLAGREARVMKTDKNGNVFWVMDYDSVQSFTASNKTHDGGYILFGVGDNDSAGAYQTRKVLKIDAAGQKQWIKTIYSFYNPPGHGLLGSLDIDTTDDGGYICALNPYDTSLQMNRIIVERLDSEGNVLWQRPLFDTLPSKYVYEIHNTKDGNFIMTINASAPSVPNPRLVKIDGSGNILWEYVTPFHCNDLHARAAHDGNLLISGGVSPSGFVGKLDQNGNELWLNPFPLLQDSVGFGQIIYEKPNNTYAMIGTSSAGGGPGFHFYFLKIDSAGNVLANRPLPTSNLGPNTGLFGTGYKSFTPTFDGGYLFGGLLQYDYLNNTAFLIKMDSMGVVYPSLLSGRTYYDVNTDCHIDSGEQMLSGNYITFTNTTDTFVVLSNDSGYYSLGLDTTPYNISLTPLSPYWQQSNCNVTQIHLPAGADSSVSFGLYPISNQPYVVIEGHTRTRLCSANDYTIQYCNTGTVPFTGVIKVEMDSLVEYDSSSTPLTSHTGNDYFFAADSLGIDECATLVIHYHTSCDVELLGRTICFNAHIYSDSILNPPAAWDMSNLVMSATCNTTSDSVELTVKNLGNGDMGNSEKMIVIEDNVILARLPLQLPAGQEFTQRVPANGATWRATMPQTPNNPYSSFTTISIEACGVNQQGTYSLHYVNQFSNNGFYAFDNTICSEIHGSYDPNHKSVLPEGAGPDHLVDNNTVLEYSIDFQNTGTDTARFVQVIDTLASYLDPATIKFGPYSHPYSVELVESHILVFTFNNIMLPDSGSNQAASNGFVTFTIKQKAGNTNGTIINNQAAIVFDYNDRVATNTATVKVGEVLISGIESLYDEQTLQINAYPNPFRGQATIEVDGADFNQLDLKVYDLSGRLVRSQSIYHYNKFTLNSNGLSNGSYIFEIRSNSQTIGRGKLLVQ